MSWVLVISGFFIILLAISFYYSRIHWILKALCLTLFSMLSIIFYEYYIDSLGLPIQGYPVEYFVYIHHIVSSDNTITLWIITHESGESKLYKFPYERETAKTLGEAEKQTEQQKQVQGTFVHTADGSQLQIGEWQGQSNIADRKQ